MVQGVHYGWIPSSRELWASAMEQAEASVRLEARSSFAYSVLAYLHVMHGRYEEAQEAIRRAVALNPYDMGARGVEGICHTVEGKHREAIELVSMPAQRGLSD